MFYIRPDHLIRQLGSRLFLLLSSLIKWRSCIYLSHLFLSHPFKHEYFGGILHPMPLILTRCLHRKYLWWLQPPEELYKAMHSCAFGLPLSVAGQLITHHTGAKSRVWNNNVVSVLIWCCQRYLRAVSPQHPFQNCSPTGIQTESLIHWTKTSNG